MKKNIFIALALLGMTTSLVSCYTYETVTKYRYESAQDDYNRRYRGYTRSQIINELGAPDRVVPVDGSSVILVYEKYTSRMPCKDAKNLNFAYFCLHLFNFLSFVCIYLTEKV